MNLQNGLAPKKNGLKPNQKGFNSTKQHNQAYATVPFNISSFPAAQQQQLVYCVQICMQQSSSNVQYNPAYSYVSGSSTAGGYTYPGAQPVTVKPPSSLPQTYPTNTYPVNTYPAAHPVNTYPAAYPVNTYPTAYPVNTYPINSPSVSPRPAISPVSPVTPAPYNPSPTGISPGISTSTGRSRPISVTASTTPRSCNSKRKKNGSSSGSYENNKSCEKNKTNNGNAYGNLGSKLKTKVTG